jgi:hypothetical protein
LLVPVQYLTKLSLPQRRESSVAEGVFNEISLFVDASS